MSLFLLLRRNAVALWVAGFVSVTAMPAQAQIVLGQTANSESSSCVANLLAVQTTSTGPSYVVPRNGIIVSWSFSGGLESTNTEALAVVRPAGGTNYTIVSITPLQTIAAGTIGTFSANIPVQAGDIIGMWTGPTDGAKCALFTASDFASGAIIASPTAGSTVSLPEIEEPALLNISATLGAISVPTLFDLPLAMLSFLLAATVLMRRRPR